MQSATGNDAGRDNGRTSRSRDDVPRLHRWLANHPDADYMPPNANFRVLFEGVEYGALQLGLLMDQLEALHQAPVSGSESRSES